MKCKTMAKIVKGKERALQEFIEKIKEKYGDKIKKVILFGSYAREDHERESDIDVLIVGDVSSNELVDLSFDILLKYGAYISPHVISEERFSYLEREGYGFIKNVKREGKIIYA